MEAKRRKSYPSDLTDKQWEEIAPLYEGMRNCTWSKRELTDAVLYLVDSGCKWRQLPHDFPPYSTVHSFYRRARISGLWDKILEHLVKKTRTNAGRKESPSYAIIDSHGKSSLGDGWSNVPSPGSTIPDVSAKIMRFPSLLLRLWLKSPISIPYSSAYEYSFL